jgi:phospholipase C
MRAAARVLALLLVLPWVLATPVLASTAAPSRPLGASGLARIKHIFVIVQEGHSFDNYFGTYPGVVGLGPKTAVPASLTNPATGTVAAHHLTEVRTSPLDNSTRAAAAALNSGQMNGFAAAQQSLPGAGQLALGYYNAQEIPYYWALAHRFALADQFFSSDLGGSTSNHQYLVAGQTWAPAAAGAALPNVPTIFNQLDSKGDSWGYFVAQYRTHLAQGRQSSLVPQVPVLGLANIAGNPSDVARVQDLTVLYSDLVRGHLPAVSYVVQPGATERAPGNVADGQVATVGLINAIMRSQYWGSSAILLTWSDWGGWYDGVVPPTVGGVTDGFRVPLLIVSPFVRPGTIFNQTTDFGSILQFIQAVYGLPALTSREASSGSLLGAFDLQGAARAPSPIPMGTLPASVASHGSVVQVFIAYTIPGLLILVLVIYAVWGRGAGPAPLLRRRA